MRKEELNGKSVRSYVQTVADTNCGQQDGEPLYDTLQDAVKAIGT